MAVLFPTVTANSNLPAATLNAGWDLTENTFLDLGPLIITGLTLAIGAGLSVDVAAGTAVIGGRVTVAAPINIAGLTPSTTNHLYLLQNGTGTSNTTGTPPANSVKLGTAVTAAATVTSVDDDTNASGRQSKVRTESLVHGAGAGHPRAVDLSQWHATNNEPNEVKGVLPAGALSATAPLTLTASDASSTAELKILTLETLNSGGVGGIGKGPAISFRAESGTEGVLNELGTFVYVQMDATAGAASSECRIRLKASGADVMPLSIAPAVITLADAVDIVLATGTGNKIATGSTQKFSFHGAAPVAQETVTGSRGGNAALADLLTKLANKGLIVDGSSA